MGGLGWDLHTASTPTPKCHFKIKTSECGGFFSLPYLYLLNTSFNSAGEGFLLFRLLVISIFSNAIFLVKKKKEN